MSEHVRILAVFLFVFCFGITASAAVFTVTNTNNSGAGSLRQAILDANTAATDDEIVFDSVVFSTPQTITLGGSEMVVAASGSLTIRGPGANLLTISGNGASRILATGANVVITIDGIKFTGGNGAGATNTGRGGAIYNVGGTMILSNSILTGNTAANGGAINNAASASPSIPATLTIVNCFIFGNSSTSSGSAMQNFSTSTLHIRNSTVSGNSTTATGIAGAFQANGTVTITNSTFSGNTAAGGTGGGVYYNGTTSLFITNSTIVNNTSGVGGGGLHRTGTAPLNIRNTIIANNNGAAATPDVFGAVNSQGTNIIGNVGTSTGWIMSDFQNMNPMLDPLAANGGLGTTHLPQTGSPALDNGQNCVVDLSCSSNNPPFAVSTDQRGITRPQNLTVDIGSVELAVAANANISGQVVGPNGPIANAIVTISTTGGVSVVIAAARANTFGYFKMSEIPAGQSYSLSASAKGYTFTPQNINVTGDITDATITATSGSFSEKKD